METTLARLLVVGVVVAVCAAAQSAPFRVAPVHPLVKVARDGSNLPEDAPDEITLRVCRGARRSVQLAVMAEEDVDDVWVHPEDQLLPLQHDPWDDKPATAVPQVITRPVRYVPAKHPKDPERMGGLWPDCLQTSHALSLKKGDVQPVWITLDVPREGAAGELELRITTGIYKSRRFPTTAVATKVKIEILDITLPEPRDFRFLLDIWQNQSSIAKRYDLEVWSDEHWEMLRVYTRDLARFGQDYITVGRHLFEWRKTADGWEFGYDLFDKYVEMCMAEGIDRGIEYLQLFNGRRDQEVHYLDEVKGENVSYRCNVGDAEWDEPHLAFLTDFARHLKEQGWFEIAWVCPTDEPQDVYTGRALKDFARATEVLRQADPEFRTTVAIDNIKSARTLQQYIDRYVFKLRQDVYDHDFAHAEMAAGKPSEWYICCHPERPNTFIPGDLIEPTAIGWMTYRENLGGLLRWSYNRWPTDPFGKPEGDGRYTAGDLFHVYPGEGGPLASVRWEALLEGIQDFELLHMLADEIAAAREAGLTEEADRAELGMQRAVRSVAGESQTLLDYTTNPRDIDRAREFVTSRIIALREARGG